MCVVVDGDYRIARAIWLFAPIAEVIFNRMSNKWIRSCLSTISAWNSIIRMEYITSIIDCPRINHGKVLIFLFRIANFLFATFPFELEQERHESLQKSRIVPVNWFCRGFREIGIFQGIQRGDYPCREKTDSRFYLYSKHFISVN